MGKYKVYFNIKSKGLCRGIKNSGLNDNIDEALELIDFLMRHDDSISIYLVKDKIRIMIWGDKKPKHCTLEIHNSYHGVNYFKKFLKEELKILTIDVLKKYIEDPCYCGFEKESF